MIQRDVLLTMVESFLADSDCYLVDLSVAPDNRIVVEIDSFEGVSVDFCADLSRYIESCLNREVEDFELEVGSTGLTEPFKIRKQYQKNLGNEVEVLTQDGRKFQGVLVDVAENGFLVEVENMVRKEGAKRRTKQIDTIELKYADVKYTKYHLVV